LAPLLLVIDILQPAILAGEGQAQVRSGLVVALATVVLAAFTLLMWVVAVLTADRALKEVYMTTARGSADFTLRLFEVYNSDRFLRIRHGAVMFLQQKWEARAHSEADGNGDTVPPNGLDWTCDDNISPYFDEGLTSSGILIQT
jgi:hypothetical protein